MPTALATVRPKKAASTVASTAGKLKNRMSWRLGVAASTRLVARKPGFLVPDLIEAERLCQTGPL